MNAGKCSSRAATTQHPDAIASRTTKEYDSACEGCTTMERPWYQGTGSTCSPARTSRPPVASTSRSAHGVSTGFTRPTRTARHSGDWMSIGVTASVKSPWPLSGRTRPTTPMPDAPPSPSEAQTSGRSAGGENRRRSTPCGTTSAGNASRACIGCVSAMTRSARRRNQRLNASGDRWPCRV